MNREITTIEELDKYLAGLSQERNKWLEYFHKIDARAGLIIAAERISFELGELITNNYTNSVNQNFILPEELANRSKYAYRLNLISEPIYQIITQLRKLRNIVAHTFTELSYDNKEFGDIFRIIVLNIKKIDSWNLALVLYRKIFYEAALERNLKLSFEKLEELFYGFIYENRKDLLAKVLTTIIIELNNPTVIIRIQGIDENELIGKAQSDFDSIKIDIIETMDKLF